jgi:phytoene synthase
MTREQAYERCARIARDSSTSFYRGMKMLPAERRAALFAVYALARRVDDIADGELPHEEKVAALQAVRETLRAGGGVADDPVFVALADASSRYPIPLDAFEDLIEGAEMDLQPRDFETFPDLERYCRCVAGSIGRLCLGVFETSERARAQALADDLGVAFQLTNILRDIREDAASGRVYVPQEDLLRHGCTVGPSGFTGPWHELVLFEARRAEEWYDRGLQLLPLVDRRSASCIAAMAAAYRRLLRRIARTPDAVLERRLSLPAWEKGWIAARSLVGAAT